MPGRGRLYLPIVATLVAVGIWFLAGALCRRAAARERAWVATLPYRVTGYEERLGQYPSKYGHDLAFALEFVGDAPGDALVRDVLSSDNRPEARWFHGIVREQLRTLHAQYPIASVAFRAD